MQASLEPVVEQPTVVAGSGAFHRSASIATQRRSSSAVRGYSSLSIMFLSRHSPISTPASGSIQVVTKVARLSREFPSSISSSWTRPYAVEGGSGPSGSRCRGGADVIPTVGSASPKNGFKARLRRSLDGSLSRFEPLWRGIGGQPFSGDGGLLGSAPGREAGLDGAGELHDPLGLHPGAVRVCSPTGMSPCPATCEVP